MTIEKTNVMFRIKTNKYYEGEVVFTVEEIEEIEQVEKSSTVQNFPFPEKWHPLPHSYKKDYFSRINWIDLGSVGDEPELSIWQILEPIKTEQKETKRRSEDPDLAEFVRLEEKCKKEEAKEEEIQQVSMREKTKDNAEPRPISIVPPLPTRFIKPPTSIKRSESTLSTGSNVSIESNSSRCSRSLKINAHSLVDCTSGPTKSKASDYYPKANKREFLQTEPDKKQTARIDTKPSTPRPKKKEINFIERNKKTIPTFFNKSNASKAKPPTSTPSFTNTKQ